MIAAVFALNDVLLLAEHAVAAVTHRPSMRELLHGSTPRPGLWLIGDQGLFLMSNGLLLAPTVGDADVPIVVFAEHYRTPAAWSAIAGTTGRSADFCAVLGLLDPQADQRILHNELIAGVEAGATALVIELGPGRLHWYVLAGDDQAVTR